MAVHKQVISRISNDNQNNILIYNFIISTFDCQGGSLCGCISARAFTLACPSGAPPLVSSSFSILKSLTQHYQSPLSGVSSLLSTLPVSVSLSLTLCCFVLLYPPSLSLLNYISAPLSLFLFRSPQFFHSKLQTLFFNKSYPDQSFPYFITSLPHTSLINHDRLTVCMSDSLDLRFCFS